MSMKKKRQTDKISTAQFSKQQPRLRKLVTAAKKNIIKSEFKVLKVHPPKNTWTQNSLIYSTGTISYIYNKAYLAIYTTVRIPKFFYYIIWVIITKNFHAARILLRYVFTAQLKIICHIKMKGNASNLLLSNFLIQFYNDNISRSKRNCKFLRRSYSWIILIIHSIQ